MRARPSTSCCEWRAVPVINENDTVATTEIRYGDNDRLAARVATMVSADLLVLLSDVDGLYDAPPDADASARHVPCVAAHHARDRGDGRRGRLGTLARRHADQDRSSADRHQRRDAHGHRLRPRRASAARRRRRRALHLVSHRRPIRSPRARNGSPARWNRRERWRSTPARSRRCGGARACCRPESCGRRRFRARRCGHYPRPRRRGNRARPVAYDADDAEKIRGRSSADIASILGFSGRTEMVHRDDLVVGPE